MGLRIFTSKSSAADKPEADDPLGDLIEEMEQATPQDGDWYGSDLTISKVAKFEELAADLLKR